jgi:hypothetical protein
MWTENGLETPNTVLKCAEQKEVLGCAAENEKILRTPNTFGATAGDAMSSFPP